MTGRIPPHDLDAESAVLAASLLSETDLTQAAAVVRAEDFYSPANRRIWEACLDLTSTRQPVDSITVAAWLKGKDRMAEIGGVPYLARVVDATPAVANVTAHAEIVKRLARQRAMIAAGQRIAAEGYGDVGDVQQWLDGCEHSIFGISRNGAETQTCQTVEAVIRSVFEGIRKAGENGGLAGLSTAFTDLDELTTGMHPGELWIFAGRPGMGKAQPLDAKVLTPTGWQEMGELQVGDLVIGADGQPTRITGVFPQGERDVFRVVFDDGGSTECCDEHLWFTRTKAERKVNRSGSVKSLAEIRGRLTIGEHANHSVQFVRPVHFAPRSEALPLDPYVLGVYLGDGSSNGTVRLHTPQADVLERVAGRIHSSDELRPQSGIGMTVCSRHRTPEGSITVQAIRALRLCGMNARDKFIPTEYLFASAEHRLELLRGLCDTDGYVTDPKHKSVEFVTVSPQLREDVSFLVRSLGGCVTWTQKQGVYTKDGERHVVQMAYRMILSFPGGGVVPVTAAKHLKKWDAKPSRVVERFIKAVEPVGPKECRCIAVEAADHLYVTDDFVVTHNTGLAMSVATGVALGSQGDVGVLVFSLEMPREQLVMRMLAAESGVPLTAIRQGNLSQLQWSTVAEKSRELSGTTLVIDDKPGANVLYLRAVARRVEAEYARETARDGRPRKLGLIVVDYLQLMRPVTPSGSREQDVSEISKSLKEIAKELRVPIIALAQLNRAVETRSTKDKRPQLSDLRESGAIEQDADLVLFLYRDEYYFREASKAPGLCELIIAKQRNGATQSVFTRFHGPTTAFATAPRETWPQGAEQ